jgi:CRISPR-associated endonuclease/helicase Cas3
LTPNDRRTVLREVRRRLKNGEVCRVVSTSLVEAGVDVDFPAVYRSVAGLDSILQAGGRCNRENLRVRDQSLVHIFQTERRPPEALRQNIAAAERVLCKYNEIDSPEAVKAYFDFLLYTLKDPQELDRKNILRDVGELAFSSIAERFHIIDDAGFTIYIPQDDGAALTDELLKHGPDRALMRELGAYTVGVYPAHFQALVESGAAEQVTENAAILRDEKLYSRETGLSFGIEEGKGLFL